MKLFIWEGNGISDAYHDDGTLVVLAGTVEQARILAREERDRYERDREENNRAWKDYWARFRAGETVEQPKERGVYREDYRAFDGTDEALNRYPDRVVDLDVPCVVAFSGGGYD